jgi:hypothetical protein
MVSVTSNNLKNDWVDNLTCGKNTKIVACIPIVNTILFCIKENRLNKILKDESFSYDYKLERLENMSAFTSTLATWSTISTITSIALPILFPLTLGSQIFFFAKHEKTKNKIVKLNDEHDEPIRKEINELDERIAKCNEENRRIFKLREEHKPAHLSLEEFKKRQKENVDKNKKLITEMQTEKNILLSQLTAAKKLKKEPSPTVKNFQFPRGIRMADPDEIVEIE